MTELYHHERDIILHTVGVDGRPDCLHRYGYRNYYCESVGSHTYGVLLSLVERGFMRAGGFINDKKDRYFQATAKGIRAVGCDPARVEGVPTEQSPCPDPNYSTAELESAGQMVIE